jgi:pimeloyl-ACP methyl ester carboxylesterase
MYFIYLSFLISGFYECFASEPEVAAMPTVAAENEHSISEVSLTIPRGCSSEPNITAYFSKPKTERFPIVLLCGGSSSADDAGSILYFHRYFLKEFLALGLGVLTLEQRGIDGAVVDLEEFMKYYTRSYRLQDHRLAIAYLNANPPKGWNGQWIFVGVSEGGSLVTALTGDDPEHTIATINWSGAGDFEWSDELWFFMQGFIRDASWLMKLRARLPHWMPFALGLYWPRSRYRHDYALEEVLKDPSPHYYLAGMTYRYHEDMVRHFPRPPYDRIRTPFLVVTGMKDSILASSDAFVEKAQSAGAPITYMRVEGMDHYIRKRPDVVQASFDWLQKIMIDQN